MKENYTKENVMHHTEILFRLTTQIGRIRFTIKSIGGVISGIQRAMVETTISTKAVFNKYMS